MRFADHVSMRTVIAAALVFVAAGCAPTVPHNWVPVKVGRAFSFDAPPDVRPVPAQGIDSIVGEYLGPGLNITFDYGAYSGDSGKGRAIHISGAARASLRIERHPSLGADSLSYVVVLNAMPEQATKPARVKLVMYARCASAQSAAIAEKIFRTVTFGKAGLK